MTAPKSPRSLVRLVRLYGFEFIAKARPRVGEHYQEFQEIERLLGSLNDRYILELGCGRYRCLSTFLAHAGARTVGSDLNYMCAPNTPLWRRALGSGQAGGPKELVISLGVALAKERQYAREVKRLIKGQPAGKVTLVRCDARRLPFADESFDAVVSYYVLEHIDNIRAIASETARVLRSGGFVRHVIDVFTGLLGGHDLYWAFPPRVRPWEHLRSADQTIARELNLNRLRIRDYRDALAKWFAVESWTVPYHPAQQLLTDEVRQELADYSQDELLLRNLVIFGRKQ